MNPEPSREVLVATLNELAHLLIPPERLTIEETKLGDGGFGEVGLATLDKLSRSPRKVAVKELRIPLVVRQRVAFRLARELKIWAKMRHPNILELIGYHLSADCGCARFVSTYMVNGNVMQYVQLSTASVAVRLKFVRDIATGLKYLHDFSPPICHGDLKPANVLVNESIDAVLCDFGLSSFICESGAASGLTTSRSIRGSIRYMSPELVLEEESNHTLKSDVWAWGCTAFEIMTERIPYSTRTKDSAVILEIHKQSAPGLIDALGGLTMSTAVDPACHDGVSSLRSIIPQCWDFDPQERPSSSIIFDRISVRAMPPAQSSEISFAPPPFPLFSDISGIPCKIAGCIRTEEYRGGGYCSEAHQRQGVRDGLDPGCLYCKTMPRESPRSLFCGNKCSQAATNSAPVLLEVSTSDPRFTEVAGNFKTAWKHTPNPPRVARVYKIILPQSLIDSYDAYKRNIEGTGNFVGRGMEPANQRRRWHGARRVCKIGDDEKNLNFCNNSQCSVCLILKNSYDVKFAMVGMFGKGIYTTATSSKSDTYTRGAAPGSRYKTMFLNKVAVGKGKILTSADNSLRAAPAGFDSVIANPGSELNYDELIVYDNNAIRPSWLLLYETK